MACRPEARGLPWWWAALPAAAVGALGVGAIWEAPLAEAGLAFPVMATLFALFLGVPLARDAWQLDNPLPGDLVREGFLQVAIWGSLVALATATPLELHEIAILAIVGIVCAFFPDSTRKWLAVGGIVPTLLIGVVTVQSLQTPTAWILLEPDVGRVRGWLPAALSVGALMSWVPSYWTAAPHPTPGRTMLPYLPAGLGVLGLVGCSVVRASRHAEALGGATPSWIPFVLALVALPYLATLSPTRSERIRPIAVFLLLLGWFQMSGQHARWWDLLLPGLLTAALVTEGFVRRRPIVLVAAGLMAMSLLVGRLDFPDRVVDGSLAVLPWLGAAWLGATRALIARGPR